VEEGSEEGQKEKNFRADEQHYTHPHASLYFASVFALIRRFPGDIPPPLDHSRQNKAYARSN